MTQTKSQPTFPGILHLLSLESLKKLSNFRVIARDRDIHFIRDLHYQCELFFSINWSRIFLFKLREAYFLKIIWYVHQENVKINSQERLFEQLSRFRTPLWSYSLSLTSLPIKWTYLHCLFSQDTDSRHHSMIASFLGEFTNGPLSLWRSAEAEAYNVILNYHSLNTTTSRILIRWYDKKQTTNNKT